MSSQTALIHSALGPLSRSTVSHADIPSRILLLEAPSLPLATSTVTGYSHLLRDTLSGTMKTTTSGGLKSLVNLKNHSLSPGVFSLRVGCDEMIQQQGVISQGLNEMASIQLLGLFGSGWCRHKLLHSQHQQLIHLG